MTRKRAIDFVVLLKKKNKIVIFMIVLSQTCLSVDPHLWRGGVISTDSSL